MQGAFPLANQGAQEAHLHRHLSAFIEAEARVQAFSFVEQAEDFIDPAAPELWQERYAARFTRSEDRLPPFLSN